jgi:hypothetical protein
MYVRPNNETVLSHLSCSGKTITITCSEIVFVELGIEHVMRMRHIAICGLLVCTVLFHTVY